MAKAKKKTGKAASLSSSSHAILSEGLEKGLGLQQFEKVACLVGSRKQKKRGFVVAELNNGITLSVDESFDLKVDGLIIDWELGTVGLIFRLERSEKDPSKWLGSRLEEAAYFRHLLIDLAGERERVPTVEVAIILQQSADASSFGSQLNKLMSSSAFLQTLGVGYILDSQCQDPRALRRCFPWLLSATRAWYDQESGHKNSKGSKGSKGKFSLTMKDFRNAVERSWERSKEGAFHIVHGRNGSGKSSFSEALELIVTGKLRRLKGEDEEGEGGAEGRKSHSYIDILTHRERRRNDPKIEASFEVKGVARGLARASFVVGEKGVDEPLARNLPAAAFILDQRVSDQLSAGTPAERARLFLKAYAPKHGEALMQRPAALETRGRVLKEMPSGFPSEVEGYSLKSLEKSVNAPLAAHAVFSAWPGGDGMRHLLSMNASHDLRGWLEGEVELPASQLTSQFAEIDQLWEQMAKYAVLTPSDWERLGRLLERINEWRPTESETEHTQEDLTADLDRWLEHYVLVDLLEKQQAVTGTLVAAEKHEYEVRDESLLGIRRGDKKRLSSVSEELASHRRERDDAADTLRERRYGTNAGRSNESGSLVLDPVEVKLLDQAAEGLGLSLASGDEKLALGEAIARALRRAESLTLSLRGYDQKMAAIGQPGELGLVVRRAYDLISAAKSLEGGEGMFQSRGKRLSFGSVVSNLQQLADAERRIKEIDAATIKEFHQLITGNETAKGGDGSTSAVSLRDALNELMALMTPARWAYEDVVPMAELDGETQAFKMQIESADKKTEGVPMELSLNTAELNTFTMAFFLLSAFQERNPLRMLIMDDPLQNMDEMTVSAVARAFARLSLLWEDLHKSDPWHLVLLLHGEENVERLQAEMPWILYSLPWLMPLGADLGKEESQETPIEGVAPFNDHSTPWVSLKGILCDVNEAKVPEGQE